MKEFNIYVFILVTSCFIVQVVASPSKLKIEPDAKFITKYVGESVNLTCFLEKERAKSSSLPPLDSSNVPVFTLNWILPFSSQEKVQISDKEDEVIIYIKNLEESDHGNYTCKLVSEENVAVKIASIYLGILPIGRLSSCNPDSFYCEKTQCISNRYACDGVADCVNGLDESEHHCGPDYCSGKLQCDDGRCLNPQECCLEPSKSPPDCSIQSSIRCCHQLIHSAVLDQDLHYLASRPNVKKDLWHYHTSSSLIIGAFVLLMTFMTFGIMISARFRACRPYSNPPTSWHRGTSPWSVCSSQNILNTSHHPTDQYLLQASTGHLFDRPEYIRRIPGLRSDLLSPNVLRSQSQEGSTIVLVPLTHSSLRSADCGPPPSYQQVIGGPPPPYSSDGDSLNQGMDSPLLGSLSSQSLFNNNNGDINGNMTTQLPVEENRNHVGSAGSSSLSDAASSSLGVFTTSTRAGFNFFRNHK